MLSYKVKVVLVAKFHHCFTGSMWTFSRGRLESLGLIYLFLYLCLSENLHQAIVTDKKGTWRKLLMRRKNWQLESNLKITKVSHWLSSIASSAGNPWMPQWGSGTKKLVMQNFLVTCSEAIVAKPCLQQPLQKCYWDQKSFKELCENKSWFSFFLFRVDKTGATHILHKTGF